MLDTNVVIDLREAAGTWRAWSAMAVASSRLNAPVLVSVVVAGELASAKGGPDEITGLLSGLGLVTRPLTVTAAILAGVAHRAYRIAGGRRQHLLGDFLIGGHAQSIGATLITRDPRRYRAYFPDLSLITPDTHL